MSRLFCWLASVLVVASLVGCSESSTPTTVSQTSGPSTKSAGAPPTVPENTSASTDKGKDNSRQETPSAGAPADKAPPTSAAKNGQATPAPSGTAKAGNAPTTAASDPALEGISDPRIKSAYQQLKSQLEQKPKDVMARLGMVNLTQQIAMQQVQGGKREMGMGLFIESAKIARGLTTDGSEIPATAGALVNQAFYNEACALADSGKPEDALKALDDAFAKGFSDMKLLNSDDDLVSVRKLPEFAERLTKWESAAKDAARKHVAEELANAKGFPFDFEITDLAGESHKLADYKGKVLIVDFWGTWCPPCRAELPSFIKLQETYGSKGFQMVGLNYENDTSDATAEKVRTFNKGQGINYPCALADEAIRAQVPNFEGYPTTLFIDANGKVRLKVVGLHDYAFLESVVTTLMEENGSASAATPAPATP